MSLARVYSVKKSRKEFTCGKCGNVIPKGSPVHHFSVGFRGREQHRCADHYPQPSERESSLTASVYAAQESVSLDEVQEVDDFESALDEVIDAINEVADEYEGGEMFDRNPDLQERVDVLRSAADELENAKSDIPDKPDEDDKDTWNEQTSYLDALDMWLDEAREHVQGAIDNVELP